MKLAKISIGIDETNYGRNPEIYVAVPTNIIKETIIYKKPSFLKIRYGKKPEYKNKHKNMTFINGNQYPKIINNIMEQDFRWIIIPEIYKKVFTVNSIKAIVLNEFIKYYGELEKVLVDGEIQSSTMKKLKLINPNTKNIIATPQ